MRRQLDSLKEQFVIQNLKEGEQLKGVQSPLISKLRPIEMKGHEAREGRMDFESSEMSPNARRYYVENLGEDMLLVDSSKKNPSHDKLPTYDLAMFKKGRKTLSKIIFLYYCSFFIYLFNYYALIFQNL